MQHDNQFSTCISHIGGLNSPIGSSNASDYRTRSTIHHNILKCASELCNTSHGILSPSFSSFSCSVNAIDVCLPYNICLIHTCATTADRRPAAHLSLETQDIVNDPSRSPRNRCDGVLICARYKLVVKESESESESACVWCDESYLAIGI